eukprot:25615-Pelagococcus_subviridis.AAC.1
MSSTAAASKAAARWGTFTTLVTSYSSGSRDAVDTTRATSASATAALRFSAAASLTALARDATAISAAIRAAPSSSVSGSDSFPPSANIPLAASFFARAASCARFFSFAARIRAFSD